MKMDKIVIVGNPNVGKSMLFNKLAGKYSTVANYPYTTVQVNSAEIKIEGKPYELVDCPGMNSLEIHSEDEIVTRDIILKDNPRLIIQCLDGTNVKRSLLLTSQLMETGIPIVLSLNFIDEALRKGIWINSEEIETLLDVPVVETIATEGKGIKELTKKIALVLNRVSGVQSYQSGSNVRLPRYENIIEEGLNKISGCFSAEKAPSKAIRLLLLTGDDNIESRIAGEYGENVISKIRVIKKKLTGSTPKDLSRLILNDRNDWVEAIIEKTIRMSKVSISNISEKIGWLTRHPVFGWPILAGVVYLTYILVGKVAADTLTGFLDRLLAAPLIDFISSLINNEFIRDFLVGDYGILSTGLANALVTTLPILFMFFFILNIMEDSGYLANLCILTCRFTKKLGLGGKSIFPLLLGFGCKTMATLTTKILDSKKERYIAIFLIAFAIPCAPQMGLIMAILASLPFGSFLIVFGVLGLVEFAAGLVLNKIIKEDIGSDFILEIPPIRFPSLKNVCIKLYYRMKSFLKEVPPLFMAGAFLLFVLDKTGGLILIKEALSPVVVSFLSLPLKTVEVLLLCLVKHEAGAVLLINLIDKNLLTYTQIIVSLIIITCFVPCFANLMAMVKQLGLRRTLVMTIVIISASIMTGGIVNWVMRLAGAN